MGRENAGPPRAGFAGEGAAQLYCEFEMILSGLQHYDVDDWKAKHRVQS